MSSPFYIEFPLFAQKIGSPLNGLIGNTRFKQYGDIRVFYFHITSPIRYYTIIITVLPNGTLAKNINKKYIYNSGLSKKVSLRECDEFFIISEICGAFYKKNKSSLFPDRERSDETNGIFRELVNLQLNHMLNHNEDRYKTAYGNIVNNESILSAIVMNQCDTAEINRFRDMSLSGKSMSFDPKKFKPLLDEIEQNDLAMVDLEDHAPSSTVRYISTPANGFEVIQPSASVASTTSAAVAAASSSSKKTGKKSTGKSKTARAKTPEKAATSASVRATRSSGLPSGSKKKKAGGRKSRSKK